VECAALGGFFKIPFRLEGDVRDERALRSIEVETNTRIRMQIREATYMIVILVCPGTHHGRKVDVAKAVLLIQALRKKSLGEVKAIARRQANKSGVRGVGKWRK